jgi:hypothetical protein
MQTWGAPRPGCSGHKRAASPALLVTVGEGARPFDADRGRSRSMYQGAKRSWGCRHGYTATPRSGARRGNAGALVALECGHGGVHDLGTLGEACACVGASRGAVSSNQAVLSTSSRLVGAAVPMIPPAGMGPAECVQIGTRVRIRLQARHRLLFRHCGSRTLGSESVGPTPHRRPRLTALFSGMSISPWSMSPSSPETPTRTRSGWSPGGRS